MGERGVRSCSAADGLRRSPQEAVCPGELLAVGQTAPIMVAVAEALETVPGEESRCSCSAGALPVLVLHGDDVDRSAAEEVVLGTRSDRSLMSDDGGHPAQSEQPGDDE